MRTSTRANQCLLLITVWSISLSAFAISQPDYKMVGIGSSDTQYSESTQKRIDEVLDQVPNDGMTSLDIEMGVYWPVTRIISVHGATAQYSLDSPVYSANKPQMRTTITQYSLSYSVMRFFTKNFGAGPFLRSDFGITARGVLFRDEALKQTTSYYERGVKLLGGVGYGLRLSPKTRGLLSLSYSIVTDSEKTSRTTTFMLNIFWE